MHLNPLETPQRIVGRHSPYREFTIRVLVHGTFIAKRRYFPLYICTANLKTVFFFHFIKENYKVAKVGLYNVRKYIFAMGSVGYFYMGRTFWSLFHASQ